MKKISIIFMCALVTMISCTKSKEVHPELGDGNDEIVTVGMSDVHVEYTRTDHTELNRVVFHYCPADANGNAQPFEAAEMTKKETFFELTLNDLLSDTLYWYYYELFPISGSSSNTVQKTFHTQAYDTPEPPIPPTPPSGAPEGAINGLFTINENGDQVYFSQGNLQYQASTNTWRFAEHQWDYVGDYLTGNVFENGEKCNNYLASDSYSGWIDEYGWGTSGYNHGAICYYPWSNSNSYTDYFAYGSESYNLFDQTGMADWGYNAICNGGNETDQWRTLTSDEWDYVVHNRNTMHGQKYAKATIDGIQGLVLFPDNWYDTCPSLNSCNVENANYSCNSFSTSFWENELQSNGAVFLPATEIYVQDTCGCYWLSTYINIAMATSCSFACDYITNGNGGSTRCVRLTVRLVQNANP